MGNSNLCFGGGHFFFFAGLADYLGLHLSNRAPADIIGFQHMHFGSREYKLTLTHLLCLALAAQQLFSDHGG